MLLQHLCEISKVSLPMSMKDFTYFVLFFYQLTLFTQEKNRLNKSMCLVTSLVTQQTQPVEKPGFLTLGYSMCPSA